ncbi:MAG TPA: HEAT repeat domain-containing protein [Thermoanaerobaculia bacterium]|nr:HEAT repeat domain-containing protein [Thermoanaerobaculia bacterium]
MSVTTTGAERLENSKRRELLVTMIRTGSGELRERALRIGAEALPESMLIDLLREDADDVARNAGLEMLKLRGRRSFAGAVDLLDDSDGDVVLQAVLLLDAIGDPRAWPLLRPLLRGSDENVVQAVITAAGRLGSRSAAGDLLPFLGADSWLQMAALTALGQLRSHEAVGPIAALLDDPFLGDVAAESLARIGGTEAACALAERWTAAESSLDAAQWLPLLAQALVESEEPLRTPQLRRMLTHYMESGDHAITLAAAQAVLSLGPGDEDGRALDILMRSVDRNDPLPPCLVRRSDLAEWLLAGGRTEREWGYELYRRNANAVPEAVARQIIVENPPFDPERLAAIVARIDDTATLVALHAGVELSREIVAPLLRKRSAEAQALINAMPDLDRAPRFLLMDAAGFPPDEVASGIAGLPLEERVSVVGQLSGRSVIASLPWLQWIEEDRLTFSQLLGEVVARRRVRALMPLVRREIAHDPLPSLVACAGTMRDRASLPLIIEALSRCAPSARADAFESIGAIGGENARKLLHAFATCGDGADERLAVRAIARHARPADCVLMRSLAKSSDWAVRYHAGEALAKFPRLENLAALMTLAADVTPLVAQSARGWLNALGSAV